VAVYINSANGFFHVAFDDGTYEKKVHRKRIHLDPIYQNSHVNSTLSDGRLSQSVVRQQEAAVVKKRLNNKAIAREKRLQKLAKFNPGLLEKPVFPNSLGWVVGAADNLGKLGLKHHIRQPHTVRGVKSRDLDGPGCQIACAAGNVDQGRNGTAEQDEADYSSGAESNAEENDQLQGLDNEIDWHQPHNSIQGGAAAIERKDLFASYKNITQREGEIPERVTFVPGPDWKLIYVGNENEYACTGVVSDDVLANEPKLTVSVGFILQTLGLEFPVRFVSALT
jgi:hypothetical protein